MSFEAVDAALDSVALFVVVFVECRGPAATGAELFAVADLVGLLGDRAPDPAFTQVGAVGPGAVCLVGTDSGGSGARPARAGPGDMDLLQDGLEVRAVVPVTGCDQQGHGFLSLLGGEVDFRGQTATGASEAVVVRLGDEAAGRVLLEVPFLRAPAAC